MGEVWAMWRLVPTDWLYAVAGWLAAQWTHSWREGQKRRHRDHMRKRALVAELEFTRWAVAGFLLSVVRGQATTPTRLLPILRWADDEQRRRGFRPFGFTELDDSELVAKIASLTRRGLSEARPLPTPVLDAIAVEPPSDWSVDRIERLLWLRDKVRLLNEEGERLNHWFQMTFDVQPTKSERAAENYSVQRDAYLRTLEPAFNALRDVVESLGPR